MDKTNADPNGSYLALQSASSNVVTKDEIKNQNAKLPKNLEENENFENVEVLRASLSLIKGYRNKYRR